MAYTDIDDPSVHFHTQLYTGNATARDITNDANAGDFKPDWVWIKVRDNANNHRLFDSNRGGNNDLVSNSSDTESGASGRLTTFNTNGFSLGTNAETNRNTNLIVAWQWKANGGTTASNTDGSITSTVQVNDDAGFSIVLYTGNETAGATIGHGLSAAPDVVIVKNRDTAREWLVGHSAYVNGGNSENMRFSTMAVASADNQEGSGWHRTVFGDSVFTVGNGVDGDYTSSTNNGTDDHIAYCFREIKGYSKFGSYVGNGNANGAFVYTGFKPAWVMIKLTSGAENWVIWDNQRDPINNFYHVLLANAASVEDTTNAGSGGRYVGDFLSNGFKLRNTHDTSNASGSTYIYMAFAEHPFVSSAGVPTTAR
jgi:hypothetical protein